MYKTREIAIYKPRNFLPGLPIETSMAIKITMPLSSYPPGTLGSQLDVMRAFAHAQTAREIHNMWPSVQNVFEQHGLPRGDEGLPAVYEREITNFKEKVLEVTRPALDGFLRRLAANPSRLVLQWQHVDQEELDRCMKCNVISADVVRSFFKEVLLYDEKMEKVLRDLNLGKRLSIIQRFLATKDYVSDELAEELKSVLSFYGLDASDVTVPLKIPHDRMMDYKSEILARLKPPVECDVTRRAFSLSAERDFDDVGLNEELLNNALASGIISRRVFHKMTAIRERARSTSDRMNAQREEITRLVGELSWRRSALRYSAVAAGGLLLLNGAGIALMNANASPVGLLWCAVNVVVGGLLAAFSTGLWRPYNKDGGRPAGGKPAVRAEKPGMKKPKIIVGDNDVDRHAPTVPGDGDMR